MKCSKCEKEIGGSAFILQHWRKKVFIVPLKPLMQYTDAYCIQCVNDVCDYEIAKIQDADK